VIKTNYYLRDKNKAGETPIILYVAYKGVRKKFSTGLHVEPKIWNESAQRLRFKNGDESRLDINSKLDQWEKKLSDEINKIRLRGQSDFDFNSVSDLVNSILNSDSVRTLRVEKDDRKDKIQLEGKPDFFKVFSQFIEDCKTGARLNDRGQKLTKASIQKYERTRDVLKEFSKKHPFTFDTIDIKFYRSFIDFLNKYKIREKTEQEKKDDPKGGEYIIGFKINTVGKFIRAIKAFMNYATEIGLNTNIAYQSKKFKAFNVEVDNISLTEEEVIQLQELDLSDNPHLQITKDIFVIGCWTGLRFQELSKVKMDYINDDSLTIPSYSKVNQKITIPLNEVVLNILKKYNYRWPIAPSSPVFNRQLKEIAALLPSLQKPYIRSVTQGGMQVEEKYVKYELVTAHTARRTFATIFYLKGVPIQYIMNITGHSKESTFLRYINVTAEEHANKFKSFWKI
tara:strand:+ start:2091 stop:3452 length:1362 start_codon:yes stop_codon:yes gene_type:complete